MFKNETFIKDERSQTNFFVGIFLWGFFLGFFFWDFFRGLFFRVIFLAKHNFRGGAVFLQTGVQ
jgi:hypothetical protein